LWTNNGLPKEMMPKLKHGDVEQTSLAEVVSVMQAILAGGGILDRETENAMRSRAGMPLLPEEGLDDQGVPGDDAARRRAAGWQGRTLPEDQEDEE
jgi:hypothetical protein